MELIYTRAGMAVLKTPTGTNDGIGAGDHDLPYRFGYRPSTRSPYPFHPAEFCRLLILRGRIQDGEFADDQGA